jgi:hypothetical protein
MDLLDREDAFADGRAFGQADARAFGQADARATLTGTRRVAAA